MKSTMLSCSLTFSATAIAILLLAVGCAGGNKTTPVAAAPASPSAVDAVVHESTFEDAPTLPPGWEIVGDVAVDSGEAFDGSRSLRLTRKDSELAKPVYALSPAFKVQQGSYQITLSAKTDLVSPDNSYKGEVILEYTDQNGRPGQRVSVAELDKKQNWKQLKKDVGVPATIVSARFRVTIDKAAGQFWVDGLSIKPSSVSTADPVVNRIVFDTAQMGNLLFPTDSRKVKTSAWTMRELTDSEQNVSIVVTDYWGAEQAKPMPLRLTKTGMVRSTMHLYEGTLDLSPVQLEVGRYYEIHATLNKEAQGAHAAGAFSNHTSFAILPYAPANRYKPEEVPFTSRTWDARIDIAQYLNHRLGIRIGGVWGGWSKDAPYTPYAATIEVLEKQGMGFLTGSPAHDVEQRSEGYEKRTDEALRAGVRAFIAKYGHIRPMIINLGNEPANKGDEVKLNVEAYKSIYEEVKKIDPSIIVVGTSVGASEDFFKAGFGKYLDAYDFHIYGDSGEVRETIEKLYPAMFAKYGDKKPIWSTELGFSSHGMARLPVAAEMVKKFSNFFAAGGANASWFGIMYPDPDATIYGTGGESHNVFDCRYERYAPKLDAISYYNMVNGIAAKKFVSEKVYDEGVRAFLFRDKQNQTLQVLYMDKGRKDVGIPLAGVRNVQVIRIDGTRSELEADGNRVTLTVGEDPLLLLYEGGEATLSEALLKPAATITKQVGSLVGGETGTLEVVLGEADARSAAIKAPFGWTTTKTQLVGIDVAGGGAFRYALGSPVESNAREADVVVRINNADGKMIGELHDRPVVSGAIAMNVLPVPATASAPAGIKLAIRNNGKVAQKVTWDVSMQSAKPVVDGEYPDKPVLTDAYFTATPSGALSLDGGAAQDVFVPMAKVEAHTVYYIKAKVTDASGRQVVDERPVGGFVAVPKVADDAIKLDGDLTEPAWKQARVQRIDRIDEFFNFRRRDRDKDWTGPQDLSADIRYLWDDKHLYVAVTVTDDIAGTPNLDGMIWSQDGLQFLVDPTRTSKQKAGRYDYAVALSKAGPQAWSYLTADSALAPSGEVKDFKLGIKRTDPGTGATTYEVAFPWSRLSPFKPTVGANLGFTLIVNEDDGKGRDSFLTWFGNAHSKDIETVGDLILTAE